MKKQILFLLLLLISSQQIVAGGSTGRSKKLRYKVISYVTKDKDITPEFVRKANMLITLTLNSKNEFIHLDNSWLTFKSSSYGSLIRETSISNRERFRWTPTNSYNNEHNECLITTYEGLENGRWIRTFLIDIIGDEVLVIKGERLNDTPMPLKLRSH